MIALTLSKGGNPDIYTLRVGTSDFRQITNNRGIETDPSWSPTGREIAFTSDRSGSPQVWVMSAEGTNVRRLSFGGSFDTQPRWSPRGDHHLHAPDGRRLRPLGDPARRLRRPRADPEQREQRVGVLGPERSSHRVLVVRGGRTQLYTMLADGTEQQPLTRDRGEATSPTWSPRPTMRPRRSPTSKERGMTRKPWQTTFTVLALFAASVVLTGCPKKPAPRLGRARAAAPARPWRAKRERGGRSRHRRGWRGWRHDGQRSRRGRLDGLGRAGAGAGGTGAGGAGPAGAGGAGGAAATGTTIPSLPSPKEFVERGAPGRLLRF